MFVVLSVLYVIRLLYRSFRIGRIRGRGSCGVEYLPRSSTRMFVSRVKQGNRMWHAIRRSGRGPPLCKEDQERGTRGA